MKKAEFDLPCLFGEKFGIQNEKIFGNCPSFKALQRKTGFQAAE
jgi:hypothetical protein